MDRKSGLHITTCISVAAVVIFTVCGGYCSDSHAETKFLKVTPSAAISEYTLVSSARCFGDSIASCGSVTQSATSCKRNCIITVNATPSDSWSFDHWEGDASGSANPTTVRMTSDKMVTAIFISSAPPPPPPPPTEINREVIGYFIQWGIYGRDYFVKDVVDAGSAKTLTAIN